MVHEQSEKAAACWLAELTTTGMTGVISNELSNMNAHEQSEHKVPDLPDVHEPNRSEFLLLVVEPELGAPPVICNTNTDCSKLIELLLPIFLGSRC